MRLILGVVLVASALLIAQDPTNILVYYDASGGYGDAVLTACENLWPTCNVYPASGNPGGMYTQFNDALTTGSWDIVVVESWYADSDQLSWTGISSYYAGGGRLYVSTWEWLNGTSGQMALANAMGVTSAAPFGAPVIPHYAWETSHPICAGITNWGWSDPGLGLLNARFTVGAATPVTGWSASPTAGQAGIVVAIDGKSVISGFTPAYATQGVAIWENILEFMWEGTSLTRSTWGEIKSSF